MNRTELNQSDRCLSFSCPERSVSPAVYMLMYVSAAAVVLLTVCGNLLIIVSVFHFKQLHTPTNMLVLSLAASDFVIGSSLMPTLLIWIIESCWNFGTDYCIFVMMAGFFLTSLSIYHILLIAVDRYLALSKPFFYTKKISASTMCIVVISTWCVLVTYNLNLQYFNGKWLSYELCPGECSVVLNNVLSLIDLVFSFIFPCALIIILYTLVFVIAKRHACAIRELSNRTRPQALKDSPFVAKSERKAAKVLGILVSVFLACLLPYFIYSLLGDILDLQLEVFKNVLLVLYMNSSVNPLIYALFYPWFRRCVIIILTLHIFKKGSAMINVLS